MREFNLHQGSQSFHLHSKRSASRWRTLLVNTARFASCVTNETYNGMVPANTKQCNSCALQTFMPVGQNKGCLAIMCLVIFWHVMTLLLCANTCFISYVKFEEEMVNLTHQGWSEHDFYSSWVCWFFILGLSAYLFSFCFLFVIEFYTSLHILASCGFPVVQLGLT